MPQRLLLFWTVWATIFIAFGVVGLGRAMLAYHHDYYWTPTTRKESLEQRNGRFELYIRDKLLERRLKDGELAMAKRGLLGASPRGRCKPTFEPHQRSHAAIASVRHRLRFSRFGLAERSSRDPKSQEVRSRAGRPGLVLTIKNFLSTQCPRHLPKPFSQKMRVGEIDLQKTRHQFVTKNRLFSGCFEVCGLRKSKTSKGF